MYASTEFMSGELQNAITPRRLCCASAVPIGPIDAPMIADGLRAKEFSPQGRLAQSMSFLSPPGMERLYSGVTKRIASLSAIAFLNVRALRLALALLVLAMGLALVRLFRGPTAHDRMLASIASRSMRCRRC
jgi:hypothetical protein